MADIEAGGVECVVVNGDLVNRGPESAAVIEMLAGRGCIWTLGNHDDLVLKWLGRDPSLPAAWFSDPFWKATDWTVRQLQRAGVMGALRGLPMTHKVAVGDAPTLLISHGSPRHYREGYGKLLSAEAVADILRDYPADILIGSHTHRAMQRTFGRYQLLNTGAVGMPFNGDSRAQYLLLHLQGGVWKPEFRAVPYDREAALIAFESSGYLREGGLSARIFYEELRRARPLFGGFWSWTEAQAKTRDWASWALYQQTFPERFSEPVAG